MPVCGRNVKSHYRILVSRGDCRPQADLYAFNLPEPIPLFSLPLKFEDREPLVNIQALVHEIYDQASYDLLIDYNREPVPSFSGEYKIWVDRLLKSQNLRSPI